MSEMYLGIDVGSDGISVALTENSETVATLSEPLESRNFERFCANATDMISELVREYEPRCLGLTGTEGRIVYLDENGKAVSPLLAAPENSEILLARIEELCGVRLSPENGLLSHFAENEKGTVPQDAFMFSTLASYIASSLVERRRPILHSTEAFAVGFYSREAKDFDSRSIVKCRLAGLRYPEVTDAPAIVGYFENTPVALAFGRKQATFLGSADRGGALVELRDGENVSYSVSKGDKLPAGAVGLPFFDGCELLEKRDTDAKRAYDALLSFIARVSVCVGGTENVARTVGDLALSALNEASLPKLRFDKDRLKLAADFDGFTPDRLCAAVVKECARRLCLVSKTPTRLVLSGKSTLDCEAFRRSLSHSFGIDAAKCDLTFAAAVGAARFASLAADRL